MMEPGDGQHAQTSDRVMPSLERAHRARRFHRGLAARQVGHTGGNVERRGDAGPAAPVHGIGAMIGHASGLVEPRRAHQVDAGLVVAKQAAPESRPATISDFERGGMGRSYLSG